jgi:hypothetical protein
VPGRDSQARRGVDSSLTWAPANVSALNPLSGEQVWKRRARDVLERDRNSLEGAFSSRSRGDPARGGVQPPNEAESRSRGRPAPEQDGTSPEGGDQPSSEAEFYQCGTTPLERSGVPPEGG